MTKFKIGDKVECINNNHKITELTLGKTYVVVRIIYGHFINIINNNNEWGDYFIYRFRLARPCLFKSNKKLLK